VKAAFEFSGNTFVVNLKTIPDLVSKAVIELIVTQ
jgi:hypothetical protein